MRFSLTLFLIVFSNTIYGFKLPDSTESGIISTKIGYYTSSDKYINNGMNLSICSNSNFKSFFDFGYYFAFYKAFNLDATNEAVYEALYFGGINLGHKFTFFNQPFILRITAGFTIATAYPGWTNILEIDTPIFSFDNLSINLGFSAGLIVFQKRLPSSISVGISF